MRVGAVPVPDMPSSSRLRTGFTDSSLNLGARKGREISFTPVGASLRLEYAQEDRVLLKMEAELLIVEKGTPSLLAAFHREPLSQESALCQN